MTKDLLNDIPFLLHCPLFWKDCFKTLGPVKTRLFAAIRPHTSVTKMSLTPGLDDFDKATSLPPIRCCLYLLDGLPLLLVIFNVELCHKPVAHFWLCPVLPQPYWSTNVSLSYYKRQLRRLENVILFIFNCSFWRSCWNFAGQTLIRAKKRQDVLITLQWSEFPRFREKNQKKLRVWNLFVFDTSGLHGWKHLKFYTYFLKSLQDRFAMKKTVEDLFARN